MSKRKIIIPIVSSLIVVSLIAGGAFLYRERLLERAGVSAPIEENEPDSVEVITETRPDVDLPAQDSVIDEIPETDQIDEEKAEYICPDSLLEAIKQNPDVYAWIEIPDSEISYPVCNRAGNNSFYLNHSSNLSWNPMGAIFTEDYNSRDFTDECVLVYGHSMTGKQFFGTLQKNYSSKDFFESHREIKVYLEDRELTYRVFAALSFSNEHILYYYDFSEQFFYKAFMNAIQYSRTLDAIVDYDEIPEYGTNLIVLSTCLKGSNDKRYLVIGALINND